MLPYLLSFWWNLFLYMSVFKPLSLFSFIIWIHFFWRLRQWPCPPPRCRLQGLVSPRNSEAKQQTSRSQLQITGTQAWSLCRLSDRACARTQIRYPHPHLSCLIRFVPFLPVWMWINRHRLQTGWIQRHVLALYRSAVCRCAAVCNRFSCAVLQPEASRRLSGRKSITAELSLACGGGRMGGR